MEYWSVVKEKPIFESLLHHSSTPILQKYSELITPQRFSLLLGYRTVKNIRTERCPLLNARSKQIVDANTGN